MNAGYLILPDALLAEVAVPGLALVRLIPAVVAPLALVSPVVAVDVAVAHLILVDVVGTPAIVLVGVVLAVGRLAVAALRRRDALSRSGAFELVVPAFLVGVDLSATEIKTSPSPRRGSCDKMCLTLLRQDRAACIRSQTRNR